MKKRGRMKSSKGQVWVETVIYTLIAFTMIGLSLAFIKPRIDDIQDKAIIEQSISILEEINSIVKELGLKDPGNQRVVEIGLREGSLTIDSRNDSLKFESTGEHEFSEPGENIQIGNVNVLTEKVGELYKINLNVTYSSYNLTFDNSETSKILSSSPSPYKILISRKSNSGSTPQINLEVIN